MTGKSYCSTMKRAPKNPTKPPKNLTGRSVKTDAGYIRPNNRTPFKKCTAQEKERRIEFAYRLIRAKPYSRWHAVRILKKKYQLCFRQCLVYLAEARNQLLLELDDLKNFHQARSLGFYQDVVDGNYPPEIRLRAQERIDKLLGLEQPARQTIKHEGELPVTARMRFEDLKLDRATKKQLLDAVRSRQRDIAHAASN